MGMIHGMVVRISLLWLVLCIEGSLVVGDEPGNGELAQVDVSVNDSGSQYSQATSKNHSGHKWERRTMSLENSLARYSFLYSACVDPSHPNDRAFDEGYFGMPGPSSCNWYHGGFLVLNLNGKDVGTVPLADMRVIETGTRGSFQMVWDHPDAMVRLKVMLLPRANHVIADLSWNAKPPGTVTAVTLRLVCYPSYFTAWNHRQGDRHCATPRLDKHEPETLELVPAQDTYLYYYDTVFDIAKGEGDGPCAMMFSSESVKGGAVQIGNYAVFTDLELKPESKHVRLAFWDFNGKKNAEGEAYLKAHGTEDQTMLAKTDFRPEAVAKLDVARLRAEATKCLAEAGDEGKVYQPKVEGMLGRMTELKTGADQGDWKSEADLATLIDEYTVVFWKVKILALLNG